MEEADLIRALEFDLLAAIRSHDVDRLDELIADNLLFAGPDGQLYSKAEDLALHRSGQMLVERLESVEFDSKVHGDTAVVSHLVDTAGAIGGTVIGGRLRYIRTWHRFDDGWRIVGGAALPC